jgi:hypothetical protein
MKVGGLVAGTIGNWLRARSPKIAGSIAPELAG